ncbi:MAG: DUF362 domain-containing protein [Deltaproteobacteria bacterium]|jgi:uncharacterized protein (DUF362 family)|nr:DUF362 domain-containing protein [Deltaproteobacteria bacterium]
MQTRERLHIPAHIPVVLARVAAYDAEAARAVGGLLDQIALPVRPGDRVLVKPNLLRADALTCTNALVVAAACAYLRDKGCRVVVGDSPGFGTAKGIAKHIGLDEALAEAGCGEIPVISLDSPVRKPLSLGGGIGLSRHALEADHILSIPRLKAHIQMRVTCAVKNLFGCVSGVRKALAHGKHGDKEQDGARVFPSLVADIAGHLPPVSALLDAVLAMHVRGPSGGRPFAASLLAASPSPVALDTAVYTLLGLSPEAVPLWRELQRRRVPGAFAQEVAFAGDAAEAFDFSGFIVPAALMPESFSPARLLASTARRLLARIRS